MFETTLISGTVDWENARAERAEARVDRLRTALSDARVKLELYRAQHSGEYVGGLEYGQLIKKIDDALK